MRGRGRRVRRFGVAFGVAFGGTWWMALASPWAVAANAPCPTPCLAMPAPDAPAPAPAVKPPAAPKAASKPRPAPVAREAAAALPAPVARPLRTASPRCTAITQRAQVGEPVSERDMAYLRSEC